jgi:hypothetical protein
MPKALRSIEDRVIYGDTILARMASGIPGRLRGQAQAFARAHATYTDAARAADKARTARDHALAKVNAADATLDDSVLALADAMASSDMGTRIRPFARFSKFSPSALVDLAYKTEVVEVRRLVAAILKAKPDGRVRAVCTKCTKNAGAVEKALAAIAGPQSGFARAIAKRDALLLDWTKRLETLRRHAAVAWEEDPAAYDAFFEPPAGVVSPAKKRPTKKPSAAANGTPQPEPDDPNA